MWTSLLIRRLTLPRFGKLRSFATLMAVLGVAIGVALMCLVLSVMAGFEELLKSSYTRITSEMVVHGGNSAHNRKALEEDPAIVASSPFYLSQALLVFKGRVAGLVIEGINPKSAGRVVDWNSVLAAPPIAAPPGTRWLWLGVQAAKKLGLKPGDKAELIVAGNQGRRLEKVVVTALTKFGIYDHDLHYARIDSSLFRSLFGRREPFYKVKLKPGEDAELVRHRLERSLGSETVIRLWNELNRNIFLAVKHQKKMLFLVLEIIISLSVVNVVNLLLMNTHFQKRDISILRAMGMPARGIFVLYVIQGAWIGLVGIGLGILLGLAACFVLQVTAPTLLSEAVYNVTKLPIAIQNQDLLLVGSVAFFVCLLFSVFPAWRAMRLLPVEALRQE